MAVIAANADRIKLTFSSCLIETAMVNPQIGGVYYLLYSGVYYLFYRGKVLGIKKSAVLAIAYYGFEINFLP